jgi:hypothetical protein
MNATADRTLSILLSTAPSLLLPTSRALADSTPMADGMMGNGSSYGHMYGYGGPWLIALGALVVGVVLVVALRKAK